jgi:hypothetical protein
MDVLYDSAINDSKGKRKKTILENWSTASEKFTVSRQKEMNADGLVKHTNVCFILNMLLRFINNVREANYTYDFNGKTAVITSLKQSNLLLQWSNLKVIPISLTN